MERIGIFCADESELAPFLRRLEREEVRQAVMLPFTLGRLEGCPVALVAGGVGKVNAAIAAQQRAFDPDIVDMETAAVAHVCLVNQVPFLSVRTISDGAGGEGAGDFEENCSPAAEVYCQAVCCVLDQLNRESEK